ncbi:TPA: type I secretion system permease/ATPase [Providencia rettgeri]|nr:type I secretion system permease/ATPase [Providencia rettgeri]
MSMHIQQLDVWGDAILQVAGYYRVNASSQTIHSTVAWRGQQDTDIVLQQMAKQAGLSLRFVPPDIDGLTVWKLPVVVELKDGRVAVIETLGSDGSVGISYRGDSGGVMPETLQEMRCIVQRMAILRPARSIPDARVDEYIQPFQPNWLRSLVLQDLRPYGYVVLASLVANVMALAGILFSMQVYDRVVPAQSYHTLYVLFGGVMLATLFAFVMRQARTRIVDVLGKRADLRVSDKVFGHALRVQNSARPRATGTFISQLRELEHVREMMTSTTVTAIADIPFFILFCVLFGYIAGPLVWVPVVAAVLMLLPGLILQKRIRTLAQENMRESSLRNAMLVESVQGMEDIKCLQAEQRFQNHWNHYNEINAISGMKLRDLISTLNNWAQTVQGGVFIVVVCIGAPLVMDGDMTTGVLVAASILSSRMIAPLASVSSLINRWQQAKIAADSLDGILRLPVDNPEHQKRIHAPLVRGDYSIRNAVFGYDRDDVALRIDSLNIKAGERIAILGRNGSGKSTLLQVLSGLMTARTGSVMLDDMNIQHIDPADVRRDIGLVSQNALLFHGSVRENLLLGAPHVNDATLVTMLQSVGAWEFVHHLPGGLEYLIHEGGHGLSGGQRQSLLLVRMLLRQPHVLLLDEPTASLDEAAETQVIQTLAKRGQGLIVATHRTSILSLVDRVLVLNKGQIVLDDVRDKAIARLRTGDDKKGKHI